MKLHLDFPNLTDSEVHVDTALGTISLVLNDDSSVSVVVHPLSVSDEPDAEARVRWRDGKATIDVI